MGKLSTFVPAANKSFLSPESELAVLVQDSMGPEAKGFGSGMTYGLCTIPSRAGRPERRRRPVILKPGWEGP